MNELSRVSNFVIDTFQESPLVNTVIFGKTSDIDINKTNIYPLVNVSIVETQIEEQVIIISYEIVIAQQRDEDSELNNNKLLEASNLIDNLNETHTIASAFINSIRRNNNNDGIEIESLSTVRLKIFEETNILDGVEFTVALMIENDNPCE